MPGLSTTYMTGTLTTLVVRLATGHGFKDVLGSLQLLVGLVVGAGSAAMLMEHARAFVPLLQRALLGLVLLGSFAVEREPLGETVVRTA